MYNLLMKELKLGVSPFFYILPLLTGALMLIPGWLYFIVLLYFCWITVPNMCGIINHRMIYCFRLCCLSLKKIL